MNVTIFYSWQSDLDRSINQRFIGDALKEASENIGQDLEFDVQPVIDRDTQGVPGSPDIHTTIFDKIDKCDIFVCDVSFINTKAVDGKGRLIPNPNVLIELGYAIRSKGHSRIIPILNTATGKPTDLPFDIRQKRTTVYNAKNSKRGQEYRGLVETLEIAIRFVIEDIKTSTGSKSSSLQTIISLIEKGEVIPAKVSVESYIRDLERRLIAYSNGAQTEAKKTGNLLEAYIKAAKESELFIEEFDRLSHVSAVYERNDIAQIIYQFFGAILARSKWEHKDNAVNYLVGQDLWRYWGHRFLLGLVTAFVQTQNWDQILPILSKEIHWHDPATGGDAYTTFVDLEQQIGLMDSYSERIAQKKHFYIGFLLGDNPMAKTDQKTITPFDLCGVDLFLSIVDESWVPATWVFACQSTQVPRFLLDLERKDAARSLASALMLPDAVEDLKRRIKARFDRYCGTAMFTRIYPVDRIGARD